MTVHRKEAGKKAKDCVTLGWLDLFLRQALNDMAESATEAVGTQRFSEAREKRVWKGFTAKKCVVGAGG